MNMAYLHSRFSSLSSALRVFWSRPRASQYNARFGRDFSYRMSPAIAFPVSVKCFFFRRESFWANPMNHSLSCAIMSCGDSFSASAVNTKRLWRGSNETFVKIIIRMNELLNLFLNAEPTAITKQVPRIPETVCLQINAT